MNPIGSYWRLKQELYEAQQKFGSDSEITFGILFADARQSKAKEYIVNYMNDFDEYSGKYFDFFIPGYIEYGYGEAAFKLKRTKREYYFDEKMFIEFRNECKRDFGIEYTYNPMLVLIGVKAGHLGEAQKIVIELDTISKYGVERSGMLFEKIFEIAKHDNTLQGIYENMKALYVRGNWINVIINALDAAGLIEIKKSYDEIQKFKIKNVR